MADQELEELKQLESNIAKLEAAIVANPERKTILSSAIDGMRQRATEIEKKIKEREEREQTVKVNEAAIREAVAKETALNAGEKEAYSGFLNKDFFTKSDFWALESFYSKSWDKLTEDGKDEMSHRVWEGVRHGEYTFNELPEAVKEKEAGRIYEALTKHQASRVLDAKKIPVQDKNDFIHAWETKSKDEACEILTRDSFKQNTSLMSPTTNGRTNFLDKDQQNASQIANRDVTVAAEPSSAATQKNLVRPDLSQLDLNGLTMADSDGPVSPKDIPRNTQVAANRSVS